MASAESALRPMTARDARPVMRDAYDLWVLAGRYPTSSRHAEELAEVLAELAAHGHQFDPATVNDRDDI